MKKQYFKNFQYSNSLDELIVGEKYVIILKTNDIHVGFYREGGYFDVKFYHDFDDFDLIKYVIKHDEFIDFLYKIV
jgi:hypothetical protein